MSKKVGVIGAGFSAQIVGENSIVGGRSKHFGLLWIPRKLWK